MIIDHENGGHRRCAKRAIGMRIARAESDAFSGRRFELFAAATAGCARPVPGVIATASRRVMAMIGVTANTSTGVKVPPWLVLHVRNICCIA
jgi:hypothetical protein